MTEQSHYRSSSTLRYGMRLMPSSEDTSPVDAGNRLLLAHRDERQSQQNRRYLVVILGVALAINLMLVLGLIFSMRTRPHIDIGSKGTIQVHVIEPTEPLIEPVEPEPPVFVPQPSVHLQLPKAHIRPSPLTNSETRIDAMNAQISTAAPAGASTLKLFNPDGSVRLPEMAKTSPHLATPQEQGKAAWADLTHRGENPLDCQRTRYAQNYRRDESVGDEVARKYLSWIGLADPASIQHRAEQRAKRAAEGCDPASR